MADRFLREVGSDKFNPQQYVHDLSLKSEGATDLLSARQKVQSLADEISGQLKRNVYNNYTQFIETAKEISYLESEMYQLSHMLTEQKELMTTLLESSVLGTKPGSTVNGTKVEEKRQNADEPTKKALTSLLEKVEGCASIMDVSGRYLVFNGDLIEMDPNTFVHVTQVHAFLLNDGIVFATRMQNRSGPVRYKFQIMYELDSLPVVNVRDLADVKNAFKIMLFPEARLFVCDSPKTKKEWLEHIETTKKAKRNAESARRESQFEAAAQAKEESSNPFLEDGDEDEDGDQDEDESRNVSIDLDNEVLPDWLTELPEDLDVCIAQRDFEEATNLIERANDYISEHYRIPHVKEMRPRIDSRVKVLTDELQNELRVSPDKSLQGGPRAARRAVFLLVKLNKSSQACDLFLRHHSAIIKHSIKQLKLEGETKLYIKRLCAVFFTHIMDTCSSLEQAFPNLANCSSTFVVWAREELHIFVATFIRQVFTPQVSLSLVADCVSVARQHCDQLTELGLDTTFMLNSMLQLDVERLLLESKEKMLEAIKLRATDDKWRPLNYQNKTGLDKFLDDMCEMGISSIRCHVYDECRIELTSNTVQFTKAYICFLDDALKLHTEEAHHLIDSALHDIMRAQLKHVEIALKNDKLKTEDGFILKNGTFLINVLTLAERRYMEKLGHSCPLLTKLHETSNQLSGSVTKYSSTGFL